MPRWRPWSQPAAGCAGAAGRVHRPVVANWDTATIVTRLELRVGKDLQYVRVNGTLVGFLVGGLLYWVLRATFGHVSF